MNNSVNNFKCSFNKYFLNLIRKENWGHRNKSFNSSEWLKRRNADIYYEKAKKENYRCRSAYKLLNIDDRLNLLKPGYKVLDIGAAPGSWSQVLAERTNAKGKDKNSPVGLVIAIDTSHIYPINGVITLSNMDFTDKSSQEEILEILRPRKLDFVLSDMAPKASGFKSLDQENIVKLVYPVVVFAVQNLRIGGGCLVKIWEGKHQNLVKEMKRFFKLVTYEKPKATYDSSSEIYLLGREFLGLEK